MIFHAIDARAKLDAANGDPELIGNVIFDACMARGCANPDRVGRHVAAAIDYAHAIGDAVVAERVRFLFHSFLRVNHHG